MSHNHFVKHQGLALRQKIIFIVLILSAKHCAND